MCESVPVLEFCSFSLPQKIFIFSQFSVIFTIAAPVPPKPPVAYSATAQTNVQGVPMEFQIGIDRTGLRLYQKIVYYGVLVSSVVLKENMIYQVALGGTGMNPFEYGCRKASVPSPLSMINAMDVISNALFTFSSFVSQIGVKDPKNPPSIVLANVFNVTAGSPYEILVYFVNPADQSLLSVLGFAKGGPTQGNVTADYSFSRWEQKVYDNDFNIPMDTSQCTSASVNTIHSKNLFSFSHPSSINIPWRR